MGLPILAFLRRSHLNQELSTPTFDFLHRDYPSIAGNSPSGQDILVASKEPDGGCDGNTQVGTTAYEDTDSHASKKIASHAGTGQANEGPYSIVLVPIVLVPDDTIWVIPERSRQPPWLRIHANGSDSLIPDLPER